MSAKVTITQTDTGWEVEARDADDVIIETQGASIVVAVHPDDDNASKPLQVNLG